MSQSAVGNHQRQLQYLLARDHRNGLTSGWSIRRSLRENLFDATDVEASSVATFETVKHLSGLRHLTDLIVENAQSRVTARPFRHEFDGLLQALGRLSCVTAED